MHNVGPRMYNYLAAILDNSSALSFPEMLEGRGTRKPLRLNRVDNELRVGTHSRTSSANFN